MQTQTATFNDVPTMLMDMKQKVDFIYSQLPKKSEQEKDYLLTIEELCEYLPEKPARQTVYGWVNNRLVIYEKFGRRLYFRKSTIDAWLQNGRQINKSR